MKDEIKEIIDRLERIDHKEYITAFDFADNATFDEMARCFEERKKLANCITNLREELEEQKRIEQASLDTINNLQEENEKLQRENNVLRSLVPNNEEYYFSVR